MRAIRPRARHAPAAPQVIALWSALHHSGLGGPCLVVAPVTILRQWQRECNRWAPALTVVEVLHASTGGAEPRHRAAVLRAVRRAPRGSCSVLITSYEMVRMHAAQASSDCQPDGAEMRREMGHAKGDRVVGTR